MTELVRSTMRLRPDRIIVGEVRGPEALDMLKAWNTGHPGGIATVHANSAAAALTRIEQLVQEAVVTVPRPLISEAILPDGASVRLDNMPATDGAGYAGLADKVDFHTWSLLKGVGLATMLGVGSELSIGGDGDLVEAIRETAQTNVSRAGDQITQRNLDVQPTITIRPGVPVKVLVTRDLVIAPTQE